ncbi:MAG: hypothetical protein Q4F17_07560 [Eubacteriales bacterium]|nr:hypothetical protein [Eubacteriales bacterium]
MDKFFYKLFGEECIRVGDLSHALYFSGKYREMEFTFDKEFGRNKQLTEQISYQSYFLVAHELCHIMLQSSRIQSIPTGYCDFVRAAVGVLTERDLKKLDQKINVYAAERMKYFQAETIPESIDEYLDIIKSSERYGHFLEECYCDFMGFKLLTEQYTSPQIAVNAISRVLNYLITQESIRSDFSNGAEHLRDTTKEALPTMYYSVLRVQLLLLTLEINDMEEVERAVAAVHQRSRLTDRLSTFIESLPDGEAMRKVSDSDLPEISKERLTKALIQAFHYCSVADK